MDRREGSQWAAAAVLCIATLLGSPAASEVGHQRLQGRLVWAGSGRPIPRAQVRVAGTNLAETTDSRGRWDFEVPEGEYELHFRFTDQDRHHRVRLVHQAVPQYKPAVAYAIPAPPTRIRPSENTPGWGLPRAGRILPRDDGSDKPNLTISGDSASRGPFSLNIPADRWPETIRVARRSDPDAGCWNNPIVAIEELPFPTYVRGVLPPEIGVFRDLPNASQIFKAFAVAAASYGLWFRLRYSGDSRRRVAAPLPPDGLTWFHIDDTACNQRYSDTRLAIADRAVRDVVDQILTDASDPERIDKYEYAASCGRLGSRPEHQIDIVPDSHFSSVCVGGWCGHTDCAGHEDHPERAGPDTCLVRGICQWGAAAMAADGHDYRRILAHYQPNLELRGAPSSVPRHVELTGFVYTDPDDIPGSGVDGAEVRLGETRETRTGTDGRFRIPKIPWPDRPREISVTHPDFERTFAEILWADGPVTWTSLHLDTPTVEKGADVSLADTDPSPPMETAETACRIGPGPAALFGVFAVFGRRRRSRRDTSVAASEPLDHPPC